MNRYTLRSGSSRWWWPSAAAAAVATVAVGAIALTPTLGSDAPAHPDRQPTPSVVTPGSNSPELPCFREYPQRTYGVDTLPRPDCR